MSRHATLHTLFFFFFNDTATTEIYTLSLHDALPISSSNAMLPTGANRSSSLPHSAQTSKSGLRSEEHTSELQSPDHLVCRLLLEKKKTPLHQPTPSSPPPLSVRHPLPTHLPHTLPNS